MVRNKGVIILTNHNKMEKYSCYGVCPMCGEDWEAEPIPKKDWKHYDPPYKYIHLIRVKALSNDYYMCPNCKYKFGLEEIK